MVEMDELPTLDPQSDIGKKEALRARLTENVIPIILVVCTVLLWFFSNPPTDQLGWSNDRRLAMARRWWQDL